MTTIFIGMPSTFGFILTIPFIVSYAVVFFAFDVLGVGTFPPSLFAVLSACLLFNFSDNTKNSQHKLAALMAVERMLGGQEAATTQQREKRKSSRKEKLFMSIKLAAPMLFTSLILLLLIIGIFTAYRAVDHIALKVLVALIAQLIKVLN